MANNRGAKGSSDINQTDSVGSQGVLAETLSAMDEWDINKLKDKTAYGDKMIKGSGSKP